MATYRPTINSYLARQFAGHVAAFLFGIVAVIALFDCLELIRRVMKIDRFDVSLVGYLALLKLPGNLMMIAPFAVLFAAIFTLSQLMRRQELIVIRTAGASIWQMLFPLFFVAFAYGVFMVTVVNPLSAATETRYQQYEERYLRKETHMISLLNQGLWLRQGTEDGASYLLMHARKVQLPNWSLDGIMVVFFSKDYRFLKRLDAPTAQLEQGAWVLKNATVSVAGNLPYVQPVLKIPTQLTRADLEESFSTPETISFWALPGFIRMLESTGFPVIRLRIHYGALLMFPILCAALIMIAAAVTVRPPRQGGQVQMVVIGIISGFVVFFMTNFIQALGGSEQIPVLLAAMAPAMLTVAAGAMALFSMEDQ